MPRPFNASDLRDNLYRIDANDPDSELITRSGISTSEIDQVNVLMSAMARLREAEDKLTKASTRYMKLNKTDMRALHYLIVSENRGELVTAGDIANHLEITTASTTKLLDRLEHAGHITREAHPSDRRALVIRITSSTRLSAMNTVGRQQAKRFKVAAELTPEERRVIIDFLETTARELSLTDVAWAHE